jgi:hypothetical protein
MRLGLQDAYRRAKRENAERREPLQEEVDMARSDISRSVDASALVDARDPVGIADPAALRAWLLAAFVLTLGGIVTGAAYFAVGGIFALLSDLFGLGMGITGFVLVLGLHGYARAAASAGAPAVRTLGLIAYALTILGSAALVLLNLGLTAVPGSLALGTQFLGMTAQGVWYVGFGLFVLRIGIFGRVDARLFQIAGVGYLSFGVAAVVAPGSVASMAGGFVGVILYLVLVLRLRSWLGTHAPHR